MNELPDVVKAKPTPRIYVEKIGDKEWEMLEASLDVDSDVVLWPDNPRLRAKLPLARVTAEEELELALQQTNGYDALRQSIRDLGQMEPVYAWRPNDESKYLILEGATRVAILRELNRKFTSGPKEGVFKQVKAKILPPSFGMKERAILLARIHVRGSGVRAWGRYIEAKFVHDTVVGGDGKSALMNVTQMAQYMEKSVSWVQRLRDAYEFAKRFVEHLDTEDAEAMAARYFSVLEEVSKAKVIGPNLRDYDNPAHDGLRADVFQMVENEVFKEYRDARFLKEFYDDADKWDQLKSGERHIASRLAAEIKTNSNNPKTKISAVPQMVKRSIERGETEFDEEDVQALQLAIDHISDRIHDGVRPFRIALKKMTRSLEEASLADVRDLGAEELADFERALQYFTDLVDKHGKKAA
jgi:hypothetical protein